MVIYGNFDSTIVGKKIKPIKGVKGQLGPRPITRANLNNFFNLNNLI